MKRRKHNTLNNVKTYSSIELTSIADIACSEEYLYQNFRFFVWNEIFNAAKQGFYRKIIQVTDYSNDFIDKIRDELLRNNMMCDFFESSYSFGFDNLRIQKSLDICWNSKKAYKM